MDNALAVGKAGEYLVCYDLIMQGFVAFPSEQGLNYDLVVNVENHLIRIQVKTTIRITHKKQTKSRVPAYIFNCRRCGKGGRKKYTDNDFDIMALVSLEEKTVAYVPINDVKMTMTFRPPIYRGSFDDETGRVINKQIFEMLAQKIPVKEIMKKTGRSDGHIYRLKCTGESKYEGAKYLDEFPFVDAATKIVGKFKAPKPIFG